MSVWCEIDWKGRIKLLEEYAGSITSVQGTIRQMFHRVPFDDPATAADARFRFFTERILPPLRAAHTTHCVIYVPSYFDYVRLRNWMAAESMSVALCCEYVRASHSGD